MLSEFTMSNSPTYFDTGRRNLAPARKLPNPQNAMPAYVYEQQYRQLSSPCRRKNTRSDTHRLGDGAAKRDCKSRAVFPLDPELEHHGGRGSSHGY